MPYMMPCVKIKVGRERAKEPATRPRRQIGPGIVVSAGLGRVEARGDEVDIQPIQIMR